ncbi:hypothetical protein ACFE04_025281 [Oxalis oulophora]
MAKEGGARLLANDALAFLKAVKESFRDKRGMYDEFMDMMKDFKANRIDTTGVIAKVKDLFKDYPDLLVGFNSFLPKEFEITLDEHQLPPLKLISFREAVDFVKTVKLRFQDDDCVYRSFLNILNSYRQEQKSIDLVNKEVAALLQDHPDLIVWFSRFAVGSSPDMGTTSSTGQEILIDQIIAFFQ